MKIKKLELNVRLGLELSQAKKQQCFVNLSYTHHSLNLTILNSLAWPTLKLTLYDLPVNKC